LRILARRSLLSKVRENIACLWGDDGMECDLLSALPGLQHYAEHAYRTAARAVASSQLTKCSWYGEDPYWGRIASELGNAGISFDPDAVSIAYGGTTVAAGGITVDHDAVAVKAHMAQRHLEITADLGQGTGRAFVLTNDLSHGYIDENMRTS